MRAVEWGKYLVTDAYMWCQINEPFWSWGLRFKETHYASGAIVSIPCFSIGWKAGKEHSMTPDSRKNVNSCYLDGTPFLRIIPDPFGETNRISIGGLRQEWDPFNIQVSHCLPITYSANLRVCRVVACQLHLWTQNSDMWWTGLVMALLTAEQLWAWKVLSQNKHHVPSAEPQQGCHLFYFPLAEVVGKWYKCYFCRGIWVTQSIYACLLW